MSGMSDGGGQEKEYSECHGKHTKLGRDPGGSLVFLSMYDEDIREGCEFGLPIVLVSPDE